MTTGVPAGAGGEDVTEGMGRVSAAATACGHTRKLQAALTGDKMTQTTRKASEVFAMLHL
ncbi:MAG TPA: hypothetical protein DEB47_18715 [Citreicella sp.]|nr:hypothetical protein [Citreicella sp.]